MWLVCLRDQGDREMMIRMDWFDRNSHRRFGRRLYHHYFDLSQWSLQIVDVVDDVGHGGGGSQSQWVDHLLMKRHDHGSDS